MAEIRAFPSRRARAVIGLDTDVLVHLTLEDAVHHQAVERFLERRISSGMAFGLTPQTLHEYLHVVTDPRRFERPLAMDEALEAALELWESSEVVQLFPSEGCLRRQNALMREAKLGRRRVLDTALAVVLEANDVRFLATLNGRDFEVFPFLEIVDPLVPHHPALP